LHRRRGELRRTHGELRSRNRGELRGSERVRSEVVKTSGRDKVSKVSSINSIKTSVSKTRSRLPVAKLVEKLEFSFGISSFLLISLTQTASPVIVKTSVESIVDESSVDSVEYSVESSVDSSATGGERSEASVGDRGESRKRSRRSQANVIELDGRGAYSVKSGVDGVEPSGTRRRSEANVVELGGSGAELRS